MVATVPHPNNACVHCDAVKLPFIPSARYKVWWESSLGSGYMSNDHTEYNPTLPNERGGKGISKSGALAGYIRLRMIKAQKGRLMPVDRL